MHDQPDIDSLSNEYRSILFHETDDSRATYQREVLEDALVKDGDWSPMAAEHLLTLASQYGSFMLRNALAVSLALEIEDGELGF